MSMYNAHVPKIWKFKIPSRISFQDAKTRDSMKSQSSSKYLKMVLLSYGVNGEDYIEEKIETFHSNIHSLLFKLKKPTIWRKSLQIFRPEMWYHYNDIFTSQ